MTTIASRRGLLTVVITLVVLGLIAMAAGLLVMRAVTEGSFGLRDSAGVTYRTALAVLRRGEVQATTRGAYTNVIFLHHSVGNNLINQGGMREQFQQAGIDFWDQGYRYDGLRGPDGVKTGFWYPVPADNTDPDGLARVMAQDARSLPVNALSGLLQHEVIILKSCYPNSNIGGAEKFQALQDLYMGMRATMDAHPEKIFILLTTPPLNPAETNLDNARQAREMAQWLASDTFVGGRQNVFVFDFYTLLAENDASSPEYGMLRAAYRDGADSHPNAAANQEIAPLLVDFVLESIETYRGD